MAVITAAWFPTAERGTGDVDLQLGTVRGRRHLLPSWRDHVDAGLAVCFYFHGWTRLLMLIPWILFVHDPRSHPRVNQANWTISSARSAGRYGQ